MADKMADKKEKEHAEHVEEKHAKSSSKKFLIIGVAAAVLIILGAGAWFMFGVKGGEKQEAEAGAKAPEEHAAKVVEAVKAELLELEPFIVNLQNSGGARYLKVTLNMDMGPEVLAEAKQRTAQIRDNIIIILSSKTFGDVGSVEGKYQLREEIKSRMNQVLKSGKVESVFFTEFVIQ
ncbi:MAG: flagellar basal body-associated FliL family protein [Deltaproteobacteria bacterium]|nr:flagellar basal body-associated FliL family protein [Deltaproteobacteria bacterium]